MKKLTKWTALFLGLALAAGCDPASMTADAGARPDSGPSLDGGLDGGFDAAPQPVPLDGELDVLSANVEEVGPVDFGHVVGRQVRFRIEVGAPIRCDSAFAVSYGFLLDTDSDPLTGASSVAFAGLGPDARVTATCDPATGSFESPLGSVSVDGSTIEILTTVEELPSIDFGWLAYARARSTFVRLPAAPAASHFTTIERSAY